VELNGEPVSPQGRLIVMPSQSTTYRLRVSYQWNGAPGQKEASVHVTVSDPAMTQFCPVLAVVQAAELWEPDLQMDRQPGAPAGPWLIETFHIANTILLPGPEMVWDFGRASGEDPPPNGPGLTYLSACVFLPETAVPQRDGFMPEGNEPAAASSAIY
jgi:hypothetical protein